MQRDDRRAARKQRAPARSGIGPAAAQLFARGIDHHRAGRLSQAAEAYRGALALEPRCADIHNNLGLVLAGLGQPEAAIAAYRRAAALRPDFHEANFNLGLALADAGKPDEAARAFLRARTLMPDFAPTHYNLGNAQRALGRLDAAIASYRQAIALKPDYGDAHNNLGATLHQHGRRQEAVIAYRDAIAAHPDNAGFHNNLGIVLRELGQEADAAASVERAAALGALDEGAKRHERAVAQNPNDAESHFHLGVLRQEQGRIGDAIGCYERAAALRPDMADAHYNLGVLLIDQGRMAEACDRLGRAIAADPSHGMAKLALCMAQLPVIARSESEIARQRGAYADALAALCEEARIPELRRRIGDGLGAVQPFYLAYQGRDDRALQAQYGALFCGIAGERFAPAPLAPPPAPGEPIRVGIVSGFFRNHSNWKIPIRGWLSQLDRRRFTLHAYHLDARQDEATRLAARLCDKFVQGPLPLERWRETIIADRPHVLIYPEIGMHPLTPHLAALRLAPVQCNSWGHPDTSGFPTLDYYLSSARMEPPQGDEHYTERLVRLPNLSIYYEPVEVAPARLARAELGLRPGATVYWCGQSPFKFLPQHDAVFPQIAQAAGGDVQFVFVQTMLDRPVMALFVERLTRAFTAAGIDAKRHCVVLPHLPEPQFHGALACCDVFLDSIGWSGCNSTLESLNHDLPIVTLKGGLMRGRHSAAILEQMGVTDTIAERVEDYVALAARLARDPDWRAAVRRKIRESKHLLWRDRAPIAALESFLEQAVRRSAEARRAGAAA